ncbi:gliding motility-associated C-terminal domain-containing protein [Lishizhenia sp.]|uniref:gliding motility-associated C-terminal domain-containing protein n=1 Tax=Lishizhenia sp. TaxID=2497594 RepID=UPI00299F2862|nr:gliding motility-associated C-terminal domain-containing protein [Lishizhenia sp.]MDX1446131.1 gliding motility-associated C-terminal domain-containing protein [Lishizhenia sp.]
MLFIVLGTIFINFVKAQSFTNPNLLGNSANSLAALPTGWLNIPATDQNCDVTLNFQGLGDTPDLTTLNGPMPQIGIVGTPKNGSSFISGVKGDNFHEGIMQTVNGLIPGNVYQVSFYQSVVKQENCRDTSGAWSVYLDNNLLLTTAISSSQLAYNDINLNWEYRELSFTATSSSHTLKFLPFDDDQNGDIYSQGIDAALRMGIDQINMEELVIPTYYMDTTLCSSLSYTISFNIPNATYSWENNDTTSTRTISNDGIYTVEITTPDSIYRNTYSVSFFNPTQTLLPEDTSICFGDTLRIDSPQNIYPYQWHDASNLPYYDVTENELVTYTLSQDQCTFTDSLFVDVVKLDYSSIGDTTICIGDSLTFDLNPQYTYTLEQQTIINNVTINQVGTYLLEINGQGCTSYDTLNVSYLPPLHVELGNDTSICMNETYMLIPTTNHSETTYEWSTGSNAEALYISEEGYYSLEATNCCESVVEEIYISTHSCEALVFAPNTFTPNGDRLNNYFKFESEAAFSRFEWKVYNRWGQEIFQGNSIDDYWDGNFNNELCKDGTYIWKLTYSPLNSSFVEQLSGSLLIIK